MNQKKYRNGKKYKFVKDLGGKCCKCGYDKNLAALDFHHIDSKEKDKNFALIIRESWEKAEAELKKCILVCRNCHAEIHFPDLSDYDLIPGVCETCGKTTYGTRFCSANCANISRSKIQNKITKEKLQEKIDSMSFTAIGKEYGVSDVAIHKLVKKWNLKK